MSQFSTRELKACMLRLLDQSQGTRWPLQIVKQQKKLWVLRPQGWPSCIEIIVSPTSLCLAVRHKNRFWDALMWPDVLPVRSRIRNQWLCNLCEPSQSEHSQLHGLLWDHLCKPLLDYFEKLPSHPCLCLYGNLSGSTYAQVESQDTLRQTLPVKCWPILEH